MIPELGPRLPREVLERREVLPATPDPVVLTGDRVVVRPYEVADAEELQAISDGSSVERLGRKVEAYDPDELIWRFIPVGPFEDVQEMAAFMDGLMSEPGSRVFVVAERDGGRLLGSLSYFANQPLDLKVEIAAVWYTPAVQGLGVNREASGLLIDHAFALGYQRIEWKCHAANARSRAAALGLGFRFEGIQERHMIMKDTSRDTAWFRLLSDEWPTT